MELPPFTTLNADVIPEQNLLESLDRHQPKLSTEVVEELWSSIGLKSQDARLHKLASAVFEIQMLKIVNEMKQVASNAKHQSDSRS